MSQLLPTHGIAAGEIFLYVEKEPYVPSGYGDHGIQRFNEATGQLQCHECGKWFSSVAHHLPAHGLSTREYKIRHGLALGTALENPRIVADKSRRAASAALLSDSRFGFKKGHKTEHKTPLRLRFERTNLTGHCQAQIMAKFYSLRDRLGRVPTQREFEKFMRVHISDIQAKFSGKTWVQFVEFLGFLPAGKNVITSYSTVGLTEMLRDFYVARRRVPRLTDCKRGSLPSHGTFRKYFGTWEEALASAGLLAEHKRQLSEAAKKRNAGRLATHSLRRDPATGRIMAKDV